MIEAFILDDEHKPIAATFLKWAMWLELTEEAIVDQTQIGEIVVSTVFCGLTGEVINRRPYFETMCFRRDEAFGGYQTRCATWDEALTMHAAGIAWAKEQANG